MARNITKPTARPHQHGVCCEFPKKEEKKNTTAFKRDSAYAYVYEDYALVEELDWTYAVIQAVGIYICAGKSVISYHKTSSDGVFLVVVDSPFTMESKQVNSENLPIDIYYDTPHMRGNRAIYPGSYASDQVDSFYNFETPCFFSRLQTCSQWSHNHEQSLGTTRILPYP